MDHKKRQKIIYGIFIMAVLWGVHNFAGKDDEAPQQMPGPGESTELIKTKPRAKPIDIEKYSSLAWGKDPFCRGKKGAIDTEPVRSESRWILSGILYNENNPSAVINKKIVRNGDSINGATVLEIDKNIVKLEKDGLEFRLTVAKEKS